MTFVDSQCGEKKVGVFAIYEPGSNGLYIIRHNIQPQDVPHFLKHCVLASLKTDPNYSGLTKGKNGNLYPMHIEEN